MFFHKTNAVESAATRKRLLDAVRWPVTYTIPLLRRRAIGLDRGCCYGGTLTAYIMPGKRRQGAGLACLPGENPSEEKHQKRTSRVQRRAVSLAVYPAVSGACVARLVTVTPRDAAEHPCLCATRLFNSPLVAMLASTASLRPSLRSKSVCLST